MTEIGVQIVIETEKDGIKVLAVQVAPLEVVLLHQVVHQGVQVQALVHHVLDHVTKKVSLKNKWA